MRIRQISQDITGTYICFRFLMFFSVQHWSVTSQPSLLWCATQFSPWVGKLTTVGNQQTRTLTKHPNHFLRASSLAKRCGGANCAENATLAHTKSSLGLFSQYSIAWKLPSNPAEQHWAVPTVTHKDHLRQLGNRSFVPANNLFKNTVKRKYFTSYHSVRDQLLTFSWTNRYSCCCLVLPMSDTICGQWPNILCTTKNPVYRSIFDSSRAYTPWVYNTKPTTVIYSDQNISTQLSHPTEVDCVHFSSKKTVQPL